MSMKRMVALIVIVAAIAGAVVTSALAFPDRKPTTSTVAVTGACQVTGTYTWSGWGGRPRSAVVEILDFTQFNAVVATTSITPADASGSLSVAFAGTAGHTYLSDGWLTDSKGNKIAASLNSSGTADGGC